MSRAGIVAGMGILFLAGAAFVNACSGAGSKGGGSGASGSGAGPGSGGEGGIILTTGSGGSGNGGSGGNCGAVSSEATPTIQPADIVIAVDTSGSMDEESAQVQQNLNAFASIITQSNIDVHVVLLADASVCIPAPLGSGQCGGADENLPHFRHVVTGVGSTDALQIVLNTYPQWQSSLRPGASRTIAVVSDDNSDLGAGPFTSALLALDASFQGFKFDAIVSFDDPIVCASCFLNCGACASACCDQNMFCTPLSAAEGSVYKTLVQQTGGVIGDLCGQNFGPVFQDMATGVVQEAGVSCEYPIPDSGGPLDAGKVNVTYTPGGASTSQPIYNVPDGNCGPGGGWYYDDPVNPTTIVLCGATCATVQADDGAVVEVVFGCDTQIIPN